MNYPDFETESYFGKYEFTKPYMLSASDCESISTSELIELGGGSLEEFGKVKLDYPSMEGSLQLRTLISKTYEDVGSDQVLILGSPIEGIYLSTQAMLEIGDHAIVLSPAYDALFNMVQALTGNVSRWMLKAEDGAWKLDFEELHRLINSKTKLLILNFPHNPTGFLPRKEDFLKLTAIAKKHGIFIFSDEMYRGLEYNLEFQLPSVADLEMSAITLGGVSKNLGLPGLRFGWLVCKDENIYKKLLNMKSYISMCSPQTLDYLGQMAMKAYPRLVQKNILLINENLKLAQLYFNSKKNQMRFLAPMAGSVALFKLPNGSAEKFCLEMAENHGIVLLPAKFMGIADQYVRMGFGRKNFSLCFAKFVEVLDKVKFD